MKRRNFLKKLFLAPIIASVSVDLLFNSPEPESKGGILNFNGGKHFQDELYSGGAIEFVSENYELRDGVYTYVAKGNFVGYHT